MENNERIINNTDRHINELDELKKFVEFATKYLSIEDAIFNIIIVDNDIIRTINRDYRNKDSETDVISFALEDEKAFVDIGIRVLGDIYISIDKAIQQAKEYDHSLKRELCFLAIHGLLHLLGYDHMTLEDEKKMFELQELILSEYGIERK